jgi:hypothetical protein
MSEADNLLKSNQEVFQVTFNGPVTFTVVSSPAREPSGPSGGQSGLQ